MVNKGLILLAGLVFAGLLISSVSPARADMGIGLFTSTNAETMMEGSELCITYKVYNPFDTDIWASLSSDGGISNMTTYVDKPVFVPKGTLHQAGKPMKICFAKENLHTDCLVGAAFCRSCKSNTYSGTVSAITAAAPGSSGSGSSVSAASGQALQLTVVCNPNPPLPFRYLVYAGGIAALAFAGWWAKKNVRLEIGLKKRKEEEKPARKKKKRAGRKTGKGMPRKRKRRR